MPDIHAKQFGPSSSCKWLNCPGSVSLEAQFPDTTSTYAKEGTLAHSIAELKVNKKFGVMSQRTYTSRMNKLKKDELYAEEMQRYTDVYVDYISELAMKFKNAPFVTAEKQVSFEKYAPGGFGTSDCIVIGENTMYVIDFKYGKGVPVSAEWNTQGMLYAIGAIEAYSMLFKIDNIVVVIIQPRLSNISEFEISKDELLDWGNNVVKVATDKIIAGDTTCVSGPWCDKGFCKARGRCRAQSEKNTALEEFNFALPPLLTDEEVGDILLRAEGLKKWIAELEDYALSAAIAGKNIPGWKVVEGRKVRAFTDMDKAFECLEDNGIQRELLYERKPLSLTNIEKLVGKDKFSNMLQEYITIPPGKPTLVKESDKREPYKLHNAAADFSDVVNK